MGDNAPAAVTTPAKVEANRANAKRSTGPRTPEGKAASAMNATRHGLLAVSPVVADMENVKTWNAHRRAILLALKPEGALEALLADRVALAAWRLGRVVRYEREAVAVRRERVGEEYSEGELIDEAKEAAEKAGELVRRYHVLAKLPDMADADKLAPGDAVEILGAASDACDAEEYPLPDDCPEQGAEEWPHWTAGKLRACLADLEKEAGEDAGALTGRGLAEGFLETVRGAQAEAERAAAKVERIKRERMIPGEHALESIMRYEAHLERGLYRALHELWRVQAARTGGEVFGPQVLDVDVTLNSSNGNAPADGSPS